MSRAISSETYCLPEREVRAGGVHLPLLSVGDVAVHREVERVGVIEHPQ